MIESERVPYPDEQKCFILTLSDWSIQCIHKLRSLHSEARIKSCDYSITLLPFTPLHFAIMPFLDFVLIYLVNRAPEDETRACLANNDKNLYLFPTLKMMT